MDATETITILSCSVPSQENDNTVFVCDQGVSGALECYSHYMSETENVHDDHHQKKHHTITVKETETGYTCNEMICEKKDIEVPIINTEVFVIGFADAFPFPNSDVDLDLDLDLDTTPPSYPETYP